MTTDRKTLMITLPTPSSSRPIKYIPSVIGYKLFGGGSSCTNYRNIAHSPTGEKAHDFYVSDSGSSHAYFFIDSCWVFYTELQHAVKAMYALPNVSFGSNMVKICECVFTDLTLPSELDDDLGITRFYAKRIQIIREVPYRLVDVCCVNEYDELESVFKVRDYELDFVKRSLRHDNGVLRYFFGAVAPNTEERSEEKE